ncbi:uncharacterized protein LOC117318105 [Pecten maximus]|uniref:uncharacterized protein LOC117318105 n=1 Tax=Pecten maximus TaxID=6579 RepID=UPI001458B6C8|nr:uncharacterized protein LOC117318105 [Pecten maximus]
MVNKARKINHRKETAQFCRKRKKAYMSFNVVLNTNTPGGDKERTYPIDMRLYEEAYSHQGTDGMTTITLICVAMTDGMCCVVVVQRHIQRVWVGDFIRLSRTVIPEGGGGDSIRLSRTVIPDSGGDGGGGVWGDGGGGGGRGSIRLN